MALALESILLLAMLTPATLMQRFGSSGAVLLWLSFLVLVMSAHPIPHDWVFILDPGLINVPELSCLVLPAPTACLMGLSEYASLVLAQSHKSPWPWICICVLPQGSLPSDSTRPMTRYWTLGLCLLHSHPPCTCCGPAHSTSLGSPWVAHKESLEVLQRPGHPENGQSKQTC